jgi:hypothetical protein
LATGGSLVGTTATTVETLGEPTLSGATFELLSVSEVMLMVWVVATKSSLLL